MSLVRILQASLLIPFLRRSCVIFDLEGHSFAINFVLSINKVTVPDQYIFERTVATCKICVANWNFEGENLESFQDREISNYFATLYPVRTGITVSLLGIELRK